MGTLCPTMHSTLAPTGDAGIWSPAVVVRTFHTVSNHAPGMVDLELKGELPAPRSSFLNFLSEDPPCHLKI